MNDVLKSVNFWSRIFLGPNLEDITNSVLSVLQKDSMPAQGFEPQALAWQSAILSTEPPGFLII